MEEVSKEGRRDLILIIVILGMIFLGFTGIVVSLKKGGETTEVIREHIQGLGEDIVGFEYCRESSVRKPLHGGELYLVDIVTSEGKKENYFIEVKGAEVVNFQETDKKCWG